MQRQLVRAGVAAGSFYEYFGSPDGLMGAVVGRVTARNFEVLLAEVDNLVGAATSLEQVTRSVAAAAARRYLEAPANTRVVVDTIDRLGLVQQVHRERDRFADTETERVSPLMPAVPEPVRVAAMRAVFDGVTGVVIAAVYRSPVPPCEEGR